MKGNTNNDNKLSQSTLLGLINEVIALVGNNRRVTIAIKHVTRHAIGTFLVLYQHIGTQGKPNSIKQQTKNNLTHWLKMTVSYNYIVHIPQVINLLLLLLLLLIIIIIILLLLLLLILKFHIRPSISKLTNGQLTR